jgi:hypothetical protein
MARCYPDYIADKDDNHPEVIFLERLKNELPDDYVVIPSLEIAYRQGSSESEADFILLHPRGRLTLEIKGGALRRIDGRWQRRKGGSWVPEWRCPFFQSRANSRAVKDYIEKHFGKGSPEEQAIFGRAVVFTDVIADIDSIESPSQMVVDQSDLAGPGKLLATIIGLFDEAELEFRTQKQIRDLKFQEKAVEETKAAGRVPQPIVPMPLKDIRLPDRLTSEQVEGLAKALRPNLLLVPNLSATDVERELIRLSAEQLHALDKVQGSKRLRIHGGPGSGKTLLAVEVARREIRDNPKSKIGLMCFNRSLGSFLGEVARSEGLMTAVAGSFHTHVDRIIGEPGKADADVEYYAARIQRAIDIARAIPEEAKFDVLIVDEGQDFRDDADKLALMNAMLKGGLAKGRWRWFEDLNQILTPQSTEPPSKVLCELTGILDDNAVYVLSGNWRNTEQIAVKVSAVMGLAHEPDRLALEGPEVATAPLMVGKEFDMLDALVRKLLAPEIATRQYSAEDVVILGMRGAGKASFEGKTEVGGFPLIPFDPLAPRVPGAIRATTVFKFKGMESHVVIVTDMDKLETLRDRRKAYVGMSRARYKLFLIATSDVLEKLKNPAS